MVITELLCCCKNEKNENFKFTVLMYSSVDICSVETATKYRLNCILLIDFRMLLQLENKHP